MENRIECPVCKKSNKSNPEKCLGCGYPFLGTENEQSVFIGQQIFKKGKVGDTKDRIKRARIIIGAIGLLNMVVPFIQYYNHPLAMFYIALGVFIGLIFIGCGFLSYKKPLLGILIPLIVLVLWYLISAVIDPVTLFHGILWKVIFLTGLVYALKSILDAERIRKESAYLNTQDYK